MDNAVLCGKFFHKSAAIEYIYNFSRLAMIVLEGPYLSDYFLQTLSRNQFPVVATEYAREAGRGYSLSFVDEADAVARLKQSRHERLYTPSENAIGWISEHLHNTPLAKKISLFKNKAKFRELVRHLYPDFHFRTVGVETLLKLSASELNLPCVIKPATGFFSLGVYPVFTEEDFSNVQRDLQTDLANIQNIYPMEVLNTQSFIIEDYVLGDEYAIDAYYDASGEPVVLGILQHLFRSRRSVSDRIYSTSAEILQDNMAPFTRFLQQIGKYTGVKNFPLHVELRRRPDGMLVPIEVNPMRFGGWCTTPDLTHHAWGMNIYEQYMLDLKPDWLQLLSGKEDSIYSLIVLDNSTGIPGTAIRSFDYDAVLQHFAKPLKLKKIDFCRFPLFGFLFVETATDNTEEIESILHDDLKSYIDLI